MHRIFNGRPCTSALWPQSATPFPHTQSSFFSKAWLFIFLTMHPSPKGSGHSGSVIIPPIRCQGGTNGGYSLSNSQCNGLLTETEWRPVSLIHHIVQFLFPLSYSWTKMDFCSLLCTTTVNIYYLNKMYFYLNPILTFNIVLHSNGLASHWTSTWELKWRTNTQHNHCFCVFLVVCLYILHIFVKVHS